MQPNSITLTQEDVTNLHNFIQEIPTKYGVFLINVLNQAVNRANAAQASEEKEPVKAPKNVAK